MADFLRKNRTNVSVIVVSFLTVILSVKLVQGKSRQRELEQELKETDEKLEEKRLLLKTITTQSFQSTLADHCATKLTSPDSKDASSSSWGWSGCKSASISSNNRQDIKAALYTVLAHDLNALVGDAALSEDEKTAKDLQELQDDDAKLKALSESSESQKVVEQDANPTKEVWVEDADGKKIVKKSVFVI